MGESEDSPTNLIPDGKTEKPAESGEKKLPKADSRPKMIVGGWGSTPRPNRGGGSFR